MGLFRRGKVWWMRFTYKGQQIRKSTETADKRLAEKIYAKVLTEVAEGKWFERLPGESKTFKEMMERYMEEYSIPRKVSWGRDKVSLKHLLPFFGGHVLTEIQPKLFVQYKIRRRMEGASTASINRELALAKHAYNMAIREWEWVKDNPVTRVSMEKEPLARDRWASYKEEDLLLKASSGWLREVIIFAVETGCRLEEILTLSWKDVDLHKRVVTVFGRKTGEKRTIPLSIRVFNLLKEKSKVRMIKTDLVFTIKGGKISKYTCSHAFNRVCKKVGIQDMRFHDLRHTFATRYAQAGVDPYTIQRLLGHKTASMTQRYSHHSVDSLRRGVEVFERVREEQRLAQF